MGVYMSNLYEDFEKRHINSWFSFGWIEVEAKPQEIKATRKDLITLQAELEQIEENIEGIKQKQLRLANLAKLYE